MNKEKDYMPLGVTIDATAVWNSYADQCAKDSDAKPVAPVGDVTSDARGTGARFNAGKVEYYQIPMFALEGTAKVLMYGAKKYAPGNWMKGQPWTVVFNSMMRHLALWQRGEELDPESGLPHIDHAMCNLLFLSAYRDIYPEGDDRWKHMQKGGLPRNNVPT